MHAKRIQLKRLLVLTVYFLSIHHDFMCFAPHSKNNIRSFNLTHLIAQPTIKAAQCLSAYTESRERRQLQWPHLKNDDSCFDFHSR